jgi:hypothetical protein
MRADDVAATFLDQRYALVDVKDAHKVTSTINFTPSKHGTFIDQGGSLADVESAFGGTVPKATTATSIRRSRGGKSDKPKSQNDSEQQTSKHRLNLSR